MGCFMVENDSVSHLSSQRMYSPGPTLRKYPAGTKETGMEQRKQVWIQLLEKSLSLANISSDLLYLTHGLMDRICYTPISQGGWELAVVCHTTSDLGAPHAHPIIQPLPGGLVPAGPCPAPADAQAEATGSWQDGGGAGPSRWNSAPCLPGT